MGGEGGGKGKVMTDQEPVDLSDPETLPQETEAMESPLEPCVLEQGVPM